MQRILLLGLGPTARTALNSLARRFEVIGLVRNTDDDVTAEARGLSVPIIEDTSVDAVTRAVTTLEPDCLVVSSYNRILSRELLARCPAVNVHYAPLPEYRGRANVNWAIINGESHTAITIHTLSPELDGGNILYQENVAIGVDDTVSDVYAKLNAIQELVLGDTVCRHLSGYLGETQDESLATYGCTRIPSDGEIDWTASTAAVHALVRALGPPYPPAYTYLETEPLAIIRTSPLIDGPRYVGRIPGRVVLTSRRQGHVDVLTGDGTIRVHEVALGEQDPVPAASVIRSISTTLGLRTEALLARIVALEAKLSPKDPV